MMWGDCTGSENTLGDKKCMGMKQGYSCTDCMWLSFPWSLSNDTNGCAILATRTIHRHVDSLFDQWCNHPSADIQCQMCTVPVPWANSETTDKTSHMTRCCTIETINYSPHPPHSWSCRHACTYINTCGQPVLTQYRNVCIQYKWPGIQPSATNWGRKTKI